MGSFFTSTQIYNKESLTRKQFIDLFCEKMKKENYVICEEELSEMSYALKFADSCKWVTISSDAYEEGNSKSISDTRRISKMLETICVNTTVIDSDCAMLDMYDEKGSKVDTLIMGRAEEYVGDDIPLPDKTVWAPLLSEDSTWEKLISIHENEYIFAEDGLAQLAPVIGMDRNNILFEFDDANDKDENVCFLYFKKFNVQNNKKTTLKSAFLEVFGDELKSLGFQKIKGKQPYLVRPVNGEILHIITYRTEQADYPEDKAFDILGGIATVYRKKIDLTVSPMNNYNWLNNSVADFYSTPLGYDKCDNYYRTTIAKFNYFSEIPNSVVKIMKEALEVTKKHMIPVMNSVNTLERCFEFFKQFGCMMCLGRLEPELNSENECDYDEGFLYIKTQYKPLMEKWKDIIENDKYTNKEKMSIIKNNYQLWVDPLWCQKILEQLQRRKQANIEALARLEIVF